MESLNKKILICQIIGIIFSFFAGSFLHFIYELSGFFKPAALIGAVNESTWEHLKIGFWPVFIFGISEYFIYGKKIQNFFFAKMINLYSIPILIIFLFYGYTAIIEDSLFFDILIFFISIAAAYLFSYKILTSNKNFLKYRTLSTVLIIVEILAFALFSYFPLHNFLFLDPVTGFYGLIK